MLANLLTFGSSEAGEPRLTACVKIVTSHCYGRTLMLKIGKLSWTGILGAGLLAVTAAMPVAGHAQAYLLPAFKECLAAAERGGEGAPTRSECYWQHQQAQSENAS